MGVRGKQGILGGFQGLRDTWGRGVLRRGSSERLEPVRWMALETRGAGGGGRQ